MDVVAQFYLVTLNVYCVHTVYCLLRRTTMGLFFILLSKKIYPLSVTQYEDYVFLPGHPTYEEKSEKIFIIPTSVDIFIVTTKNIMASCLIFLG